MALSTYAELQAALLHLLNREGDAELSAVVPDHIRMMEADFDAREIVARHRRRICRSSAEISNEYESLAVNYLSVQTIRLARARFIWDLRFFPAPEQTYTCDFTVYERLPSLVTAPTHTNWLLTYYPHVYLYGSAIQSPTLVDDPMLPVFTDRYERAVLAAARPDPTPTSNLPLRTELTGLTRRRSTEWM